MQDISANGFRPAKGLMRLTWPQIEKIDAVVSSLCGWTEETGGEAKVTLIIKKGKLRFVERPVLSEELFPTRS